MKKKYALLIFLWVLSVAGISFYGGAVSYGFFYTVTLIPAVCLLYIAAVIVRFRVYQCIGSRDLVCGRPESYYFILHNQDLFGFSSMKLHMFSSFSEVKDIDDEDVYELLPKTQIKLETQIVCRYRGEYEVGIKEIEFGDFLDLFRIRYRIPGSVKVFVEPRLVEIEELKAFEDMRLYVNRDSFNKNTDPDMTVRDYQEGDSLKLMNWKATAREMKLKVREVKGDEQQKVYILFDTKRIGRDNHIYIPAESKLLETVLAVSCSLFRKGISQNLLFMSQGLKESSPDGMHDFDECRKVLSGTVFDESNSAEELLADTMHKAAAMSAGIVILVLFSITQEMKELCTELNDAGIFLIIYVISDDDAAVSGITSDERKIVRQISLDSDLKEVL